MSMDLFQRLPDTEREANLTFTAKRNFHLSLYRLETRCLACMTRQADRRWAENEEGESRKRTFSYISGQRHPFWVSAEFLRRNIYKNKSCKKLKIVYIIQYLPNLPGCCSEIPFKRREGGPRQPGNRFLEWTGFWSCAAEYGIALEDCMRSRSGRPFFRVLFCWMFLFCCA